MRGNLGTLVPPHTNAENHPLLDDAECLTCYETVQSYFQTCLVSLCLRLSVRACEILRQALIIIEIHVAVSIQISTKSTFCVDDGTERREVAGISFDR